MCHVEHRAGRTHDTRRAVSGNSWGVQERKTVHYSGRVQGVGFRWTVLRSLEGMPVSGFVRNLPDGRVELVLEGRPDAIDEALGRVRRALGHYIAAEERTTAPATGEFKGFRITP